MELFGIMFGCCLVMLCLAFITGDSGHFQAAFSAIGFVCYLYLWNWIQNYLSEKEIFAGDVEGSDSKITTENFVSFIFFGLIPMAYALYLVFFK